MGLKRTGCSNSVRCYHELGGVQSEADALNRVDMVEKAKDESGVSGFHSWRTLS